MVVDAETLHELELRAAAEGTDLNAAAAARSAPEPTPPELLRQRPGVSALG